MVIDTSAVAAILFQEADGERYVLALEKAAVRLVSAVTRVEMSCVIEGRRGEIGRRALERFLAVTGIEIVPVTPDQATLAIGAFRAFGKGRHRAGLNIGDCFSYGLSKASGLPLLFKGDDFTQTDIHAALPRTK